MPNLTDVLEDEDEITVQNIAKGVCLPLVGGTLPTNAFINFTVDDTNQSGYTWTAPNGTWTSKTTHGTGYTFDFNTGTGADIKFEIHEDAGRLSNRDDGVFWENERVLVSAPIASADAITNIMELTQTEYDAITPVASTLYVINGA